MVGIQPDTSPSDSSTEQHIFCWFHSKCFKMILTMAGELSGDLSGDLHMNKLGFVQNRTVSFVYIYICLYTHNYVITKCSWTRTHTCIYYNLPCVCIYHYFFTKRNEQTLVYCGIIPGKGWAKAEWGHLRDRIDGGFSNYLDCFIDFIINFETSWYLKFFSWKIME